MCDAVELELLTSIHRSVNDDVKSNNELYGGKRIQEACNPFVLLRYCESSVIVILSERIQIDEERQTFEPERAGQRQRSMCSTRLQ